MKILILTLMLISINANAIDCTTDRDCRIKTYCHDLAIKNGFKVGSAQYDSFIDECSYWDDNEKELER